MFDFNKVLMDFFVRNPYLFTPFKVSPLEYSNFMVKNEVQFGNAPFFNIDINFIEDHKNKIVQTFQVSNNQGGVFFTTYFQFSKLEHLFGTYVSMEEKLALQSLVFLADNSRFPYYLEYLEKYRLKPKQAAMGFSPMLQNIS